MGFSYKTKNLGLPVWGSNDKPTQDDLNYQNEQIDKKFNEKPYHNIVSLTNKKGDFISLKIRRNKYFLNMKDQYDKTAILSINCGIITDSYYGPQSTFIHFLPYDWFSGNIDDIVVSCITKEGE